MFNFENFVSAAVKKCVEDDKFVHIKSKPTNNELRGRVIDYLNSVVREKKKAEAKKKAEMRMKNIRARTTRFRLWLINNWKNTPLNACKERDLLKQALLSEKGVLRNLHFLEHNEIEDVLKGAAERRSSSAGDDEDEDEDDVYDEFLLFSDVYHGNKVERPGWVAIEPWWWSPVVNPPCCLDWL
ncbi:hypothetical protein AYX14_06942 [Cryptococcus neoformans]|nr:hypothetical protein AYX14_06942 [Cryptococcus neoformans var. grubii]